ncbi:hypothetical protein HL666_14810 [Bradyrhizobium sp. 83002]|uniref:hypothetical protein n=1 Tax=Bradyrhizobium aeschynomenes TaxID=2734909 RepID=UPI0015577C4B|nr:hypothetical protein [Bradyrhizobium aeschynomenes]NPU12040.1 hypothetical protein [Bradyrhizobium aeschynomenes]
MVGDDNVISEGRKALARIREGEKLSFQDWCAVGCACRIGRREAMTLAKVNSPKGTAYSLRMNGWLAEHGLGDISRMDQFWSVQMADNAEAIAAWRDALPDAKRCRFTTPHGIVSGWQRSLQCPSPKLRNTVQRPRAAWKAKGAPIGIPGEMIRRAALAMREEWSNDVFVLARVALQAAFRTEIDVIELLPKHGCRGNRGQGKIGISHVA